MALDQNHFDFVQALHVNGPLPWARKKQLHGLFKEFDLQIDRVSMAQTVEDWRNALADLERITERIYVMAEQDKVGVITAKLEATG